MHKVTNTLKSAAMISELYHRISLHGNALCARFAHDCNLESCEAMLVRNQQHHHAYGAIGDCEQQVAARNNDKGLESAKATFLG
jgi:hypothetical protein